MLLLLILTLLGLSAMKAARMEERMAGNSRDVNVAFQGAEAGLRDAETRIGALTTRPDSCAGAPCTSVWEMNVLPDDLRDQTVSWWDTNAQEYGAAGVREVTETASEPQAVTEDLGFIRDSLTVGHGPPEGRNFYRVTARSTGATPTAQAVLESTYARRY
jgi:type IV pilus assembly protein PilX